MTHLTPQQFVGLIGGTPDAASRVHLQTCEPCRTEVSQLLDITAAAAISTEVPEPSPLFWDHLSARVRESVAAEPAPRQWMSSVWRPMMALGLAAACVALVVVVRTADVPSASLPAVTAEAALAPQSLDPAQVFVMQVASTVSWDELKRAAAPSSDGTAAALDSLTPKEREAFARLLKTQMDGQQ